MRTRETVAMPLRVEARDILDVAELCGLSDYPLWAGSERRISDFDIATALAEGRFMAPDDSRDPNTPMTALDLAPEIGLIPTPLASKHLQLTQAFHPRMILICLRLPP